MIPFQIITIPVLVYFALVSAVRMLRDPAHRWITGFRAVVLLASAIVILEPETTTRMAHALGIGRGTDLVIYVVAISTIWSFFHFSRVTRRIESEITAVVRHMALAEATRPGNRDVDPA